MSGIGAEVCDHLNNHKSLCYRRITNRIFLIVRVCLSDCVAIYIRSAFKLLFIYDLFLESISF